MGRKSQFVGLHLDFIGFGASLLCALHCAALPLLLSLAPLAGLQVLENPKIEYAIILTSFFIASLSLGHGYFRLHSKILGLTILLLGFFAIGSAHFLVPEYYETMLTTAGAILVAMAHVVNWKHIKQSSEPNDCV